MRKGSKQKKTLDIRQKNFDLGSQASKHDKQGDRWVNGGYHRPGSNKK